VRHSPFKESGFLFVSELLKHASVIELSDTELKALLLTAPEITRLSVAADWHFCAAEETF
jgi:hypothetical protein